MAVLIGQEQIGFGALADDLQLGAQRVQFLALGQGRLLDHIICGPPGHICNAVQCIIALLREKLAGASDKWELKTVWGVGYKFEVRQ